MISTFTVYLRLGFEHLLDLQGYDHILFLAVLCAAYSLKRWRELLVLVTAFTIGHSVSLAVATLRLVRVDTGLVEFLIPVTIVATAVTNLVGLRREDPAEHKVAARPLRYALALAFGVVHGLGFSNFLRLALGEERSLFVPLLSFNIGLELAQIVVAVGVLVVALVAVRFLSLPERAWTLLLSALAGGVAAVMAVQRWPG
ncbi:MAG: HupE/UreJ family protein [Gemmatimonadota bacterium]|nr:HupE/UreJ family protein [Gemmatimonadota bacterium]MDE2984498.1 HupE/UreJ family protein [Gemmatimonadota bacterium]